MVMAVEPLRSTIRAAKDRVGEAVSVGLLSPQGQVVDQSAIRELAQRQDLILVCGRYAGIDERLIEKLRNKGVDKFLAYEVELEAVKQQYAHSFEGVVHNLDGVEDIRVLDFNGHQIMARFSLQELGDPIKFG